VTARAPIQLIDAGKQYTKYDDAPMIITTALRFRARTKRSRIWAVRHVELEAQPGECVGVIGRNGAGKSTMLQMLAGVTAPSEGRVAVRGRVAPLIAVGVGFHPELTGRENVYVNGTILGMRRREIDRRFDEIVDFAEIEEFIDTPVKFYSSGMFVRLGFSVAIQAEPDVLLVDEVLAVGDLAFQLKCFDKMMERRKAGTTIAVVSHNLNAVRRMCDRTLLLHRGQPHFLGDTPEAIARYHALMGEDRDLESMGDDGEPVSGSAHIESFSMLGPDGRPAGEVATGTEVVFRVVTNFERDMTNPMFSFVIYNAKGIGVYSESSVMHPVGARRRGERIAYDVRVPLRLVNGSYVAETTLYDSDMKTVVDRVPPVAFYVTGRNMVEGIADLGAQFSVQSLDDNVASPEAASP
jgi:lipopolysaccharide transport system ATP-binding protein